MPSVTLSTSVDVSDSLDEARTRLLRTARALNGAWAAALCSMVLLVLGSLALLLVAVTLRPVYVVIWSVLLAATGYNATRFWPRRRVRSGGLLSRLERDALRGALDPGARLTWPDEVRLVARPELELAEGELVLGLPLLASLDPHELGELLEIAGEQAGIEGERSVRWALRIAHGDVGRPLVGRRLRRNRATSRLTAGLRRRSAALEADLGNWAGACERATLTSTRSRSAALTARAQVVDAWLLLRQEWLEPAFVRGRRHVAPFTGLRRFVEGADAAGWLRGPRPWWPPTGVLADLVARHEETVALQLDDRGELLRPITWDQHPGEVTLPQWRALVTGALDAARRATQDPAVTLETLLVLLENGQGPQLARTDHTEHGLPLGPDPTGSEWSERFAARVLTAAIGVAAVDSQHFRAAWSWPQGTRLTGADGWTLPLESMVTDVLAMVRDGGDAGRAYAELRVALEQLGIDVHEPLWLDPDPAGQPERPIGSFAARQGLVARLVIVTDRAMHVFRDPQGARLSRLARPVAPRDASVELRKRKLTVWQGETTDEVLTLAAADVRRARLGPATGGLWWRLTLTCAEGTVVLRGRGDGRAEVAEIREWLGDRVERPWLDAAPAVRSLRNALGLGGLTAGTFALLWGVLLTILPPEGMPAALPAALATGGFGALLVALLPDALLELWHRGRRARVAEPVPD